MVFLPRKENSSACGRVECNPIQVCILPSFCVKCQEIIKHEGALSAVWTQRSQEVNYSRLQQHHGGEKKEKQHTGRLDPIIEAVKTCWSLFFGALGSRVGSRRGVCWILGSQKTKHKRISQELRCLLEGRICFHSWFLHKLITRSDGDDDDDDDDGGRHTNNTDAIAAVMYLFLWKFARCH